MTAANRGLVRPPIMYGAAIATGLVLELGLPAPFLPGLLAGVLGTLLVFIALATFFCSVRAFEAAGTPVPGNLPSTAMVRSGPYRFSRNPIYLAFSIFHLGIACWANGAWLIATLGAATAVMGLVVIPREERYLEKRFGADYADYKRSVRRWL